MSFEFNEALAHSDFLDNLPQWPINKPGPSHDAVFSVTKGSMLPAGSAKKSSSSSSKKKMTVASRLAQDDSPLFERLIDQTQPSPVSTISRDVDASRKVEPIMSNDESMFDVNKHLSLSDSEILFAANEEERHATNQRIENSSTLNSINSTNQSFNLQHILQNAEKTIATIQNIRNTNSNKMQKLQNQLNIQPIAAIPQPKVSALAVDDRLKDPKYALLMESQVSQPQLSTQLPGSDSGSITLSYPQNFIRPVEHSIFTKTYETQLKLLLDGMPEAYIDEEMQQREISDKAIRKILEENGPKPSQLMFPTLYSVTQQLMKTLSNVTELQVCVHDLFIKSIKCGVRRKGTFIVIRPPYFGKDAKYPSTKSFESIGKLAPYVDSNCAVIALPELEDGVTRRRAEVASALKPRDALGKRSPNNAAALVESYFSGVVRLRPRETNDGKDTRVGSFPVSISDELIKNWLSSNSPQDSIRIELYSTLNPSSNMVRHNRGVADEVVLFGFANVSLRGLLSSNSLEAVATCPLLAEATTVASVTGRLTASPVGRYIASLPGKIEDGNHDIGIVTISMKLLGDASGAEPNRKEPASVNTRNTQSQSKQLVPKTATIVPAPALLPEADKAPNLAEILHYAPRTGNEDTLQNAFSQQSVQEKFYAVGIHAISCNIVTSFYGTPPELYIRYKTSTTRFHSIGCSAIFSSENDATVFYKFHDYGVHEKPKPPTIELWMRCKEHDNEDRLIGYVPISAIATSGQDICTIAVTALEDMDMMLYNCKVMLTVLMDKDEIYLRSRMDVALQTFESAASLAKLDMPLSPTTVQNSLPMRATSPDTAANATTAKILSDEDSFVTSNFTNNHAPLLTNNNDDSNDDNISVRDSLDEEAISYLTVSPTPKPTSPLSYANLSGTASQTEALISSDVPGNHPSLVSTELTTASEDRGNQFNHQANNVGQPVLHIIDLRIEGRFDGINAHSTSSSANNHGVNDDDVVLGCYVCYELPTTKQVHTLWWDKEFDFSNGTNTHRIASGEEQNLDKRNTSNAESLVDMLFPMDHLGDSRFGIDLFLVQAASQGLPAFTPISLRQQYQFSPQDSQVVFGKCTINWQDVESILDDVGGTVTMRLPISSRLPLRGSCTMKVTLSHHIEPVHMTSYWNPTRRLLQPFQQQQHHHHQPQEVTHPASNSASVSTASLPVQVDTREIIKLSELDRLREMVPNVIEMIADSHKQLFSYPLEMPLQSSSFDGARKFHPLAALASIATPALLETAPITAAASAESFTERIDDHQQQQLEQADSFNLISEDCVVMSITCSIECFRGIFCPSDSRLYVIGSLVDDGNILPSMATFMYDHLRTFSSNLFAVCQQETVNEVHIIHLTKPNPQRVDSCDRPSSIAKGAALVLKLFRRDNWLDSVNHQLLASSSSFTSSSASYSTAASNIPATMTAASIGDVAIGQAIIDLSTLSYGLEEVYGWYRIVDSMQHEIGLVKVKITPSFTRGIHRSTHLSSSAQHLQNAVPADTGLAKAEEEVDTNEAETSEDLYDTLHAALQRMTEISNNMKNAYYAADSSDNNNISINSSGSSSSANNRSALNESTVSSSSRSSASMTSASVSFSSLADPSQVDVPLYLPSVDHDPDRLYPSEYDDNDTLKADSKDNVNISRHDSIDDNGENDSRSDELYGGYDSDEFEPEDDHMQRAETGDKELHAVDTSTDHSLNKLANVLEDSYFSEKSADDGYVNITDDNESRQQYQDCQNKAKSGDYSSNEDGDRFDNSLDDFDVSFAEEDVGIGVHAERQQQKPREMWTAELDETGTFVNGSSSVGSNNIMDAECDIERDSLTGCMLADGDHGRAMQHLDGNNSECDEEEYSMGSKDFESDIDSDADMKAASLSDSGSCMIDQSLNRSENERVPCDANASGGNQYYSLEDCEEADVQIDQKDSAIVYLGERFVEADSGNSSINSSTSTVDRHVSSLIVVADRDTNPPNLCSVDINIAYVANVSNHNNPLQQQQAESDAQINYDGSKQSPVQEQLPVDRHLASDTVSLGVPFHCTSITPDTSVAVEYRDCSAQTTPTLTNTVSSTSAYCELPSTISLRIRSLIDEELPKLDRSSFAMNQARSQSAVPTTVAKLALLPDEVAKKLEIQRQAFRSRIHQGKQLSFREEETNRVTGIMLGKIA